MGLQVYDGYVESCESPAIRRSSILEYHRRIPGVDLVPKAGTSTVNFEVHPEPFCIRAGRQLKFQYRRVMAAYGATYESGAASKHGVRRVGDTP